MEGTLMRKLLPEDRAGARLLLLPQLLCALNILPHALLLGHLASALNLIAFVLPGRGSLLVAHEPHELAQTPGLEGFLGRIVRVVDIWHEVRGLLYPARRKRQ